MTEYNDTENTVYVSVEHDGNKYMWKSEALSDSDWETTLYMDETELSTEGHRTRIDNEDKKRDRAFAKRIMIEFGKTSPDKFLKPVYLLITESKKKSAKIDEIEGIEREKHRVLIEKIAATEIEHDQEFETRRAQEKQDRINEKAHMYEVLANKDGKYTTAEIDATKIGLRHLLMNTFWKVEGASERSLGHLSLQRNEIAKYLNSAFNLVRFGGKIWYYDWDSACFTYDADNDTLHTELATILLNVGDGDTYKYNGKARSDRDDIIDTASWIDKDRVFKKKSPFNKVKNVINCLNGVIELDYEHKTCKLLGKRPEYAFNYCIDAIYNPNASPEKANKIIDRVVGRPQRDIIYQIPALAIRDTDPKLKSSKVCYLFIGDTGKGKSTIQEFLSNFLGEDVVSNIPLYEIVENKYTKPLLEGKLLNIDDELPVSLAMTESREVKALTGTKFHTVEPKNVQPYKAVISAILCFAGNQFPKCNVAKSDTAYWQRWDAVYFDEPALPMDENFGEENFTQEVMSGFLNGVIDMMFTLYDRIKAKEGIIRNIGKVKIYDEWQKSASTVYRFMQKMTVPIGEFIAPVDYDRHVFFAYYKEWCNAEGIPREDQVWELQEFSRELIEKCNVKKVHTSPTVYVYRMLCEYVGAFLMPDPEPRYVEDIHFNTTLTAEEVKAIEMLKGEDKEVNVWD